MHEDVPETTRPTSRAERAVHGIGQSRTTLVEAAKVKSIAIALVRVALHHVDGGHTRRDLEGHIDKGHHLRRVDVTGQGELDGVLGGS